MSRRAWLYIVGSVSVPALAGCGGGWFMQQREPWRHDAEVACLQSGQVKITPAVAQLPAISGPGICGADFPLKVSALGDSAVLGFADDLRPGLYTYALVVDDRKVSSKQMLKSR